MRRTGLDQVIQISGAVDHTVNFDNLPTDDIEEEIGFDNQNTVPIFSKFGMAGNPTQERLSLKEFDAFVKPLDKRQSAIRSVLSDIIEDLDQVILRNGKIPQCMFTEHALDGEVWSSFGCV